MVVPEHDLYWLRLTTGLLSVSVLVFGMLRALAYGLILVGIYRKNRR